MRLFAVILLFILTNCGQNTTKMTHKYTNALATETSPYLLQHAHNPVNWFPWNQQTLNKAKQENKLIIISIGYAACHWCHVMEHESFEDETVAKLMNTHFVNIKVDREERPDVDQVYMNAVQLMTGSGGWPLNVVALPDGRPVWGGTYFKKEQWFDVLTNIQKLYAENPNQLYNYANKLEQGIKTMDLVEVNTSELNFNKKTLTTILNNWENSFDNYNGGMKQAPKFMMPNNYSFLMRYAYQTNDSTLLDFVNLTLTKMAYGGIYDHVGGGFSRYSVDEKWHIPHFEKMLYDNAQLVSLYAQAFALTKNPLYKNVVFETLAFAEEELMNINGYFYSSLDADSKTNSGHLEEGAYYIWKKEELKTLLKTDFELFKDYYNINNYGFWEHNNYVLIRNQDDASFTAKHNLTQNGLDAKKQQWKAVLKKERNKRDKPRLDDKSLTSWNALMVKAYVDAYKAFGNKQFLNSALKAALFIEENQLQNDGQLFHSFKNGKSTINGFLEDYAFTIEAFLALYEATLNTKWLELSKKLTTYTLTYFYNEANNMFYFTSTKDDDLISKNIEYRDNVIPASNSVMAKNLFKLSHHLYNTEYFEKAQHMLHNVSTEFEHYPSGFSNWMDLMLNYTNPYFEVVVNGENAATITSELNKHYLPNTLIIGNTSESNLPLFKNRFLEQETLIYVCVNNSCKLPTNSIDKALGLIDK